MELSQAVLVTFVSGRRLGSIVTYGRRCSLDEWALEGAIHVGMFGFDHMGEAPWQRKTEKVAKNLGYVCKSQG
ncbi:hypothetical protein GQ43DRAFT_103370 [Delitschia confertaspora ATCC 74209]|uniref:Uncharacterized protein n=1 Tax=Delitschia confertaspora ATCC 74209 TaxID=1513339 RepID=A0A9P4JTK5_9PLEO|nr:hypothetical protein GQ43DRAFT_103370 [Delitschia confertaspora ATCC 74209]